MAIDTSVPRTRRALLAGGIGGLAAVVASALGRPMSIRADNGDPVILGSTSNKSSGQTLIDNTASGNAFTVVSHGVSGFALNAMCWDTGSATRGLSAAVVSPTGFGVVGSGAGTGVLGTADSRTGVWGTSGSSPGYPISPAKTGVYGYAAQDAGAVGVRGASTAGTGVLGASDTGDGVAGSSGGTNKSGVYGYSSVMDGFGAFGRNKASGATGALGAGTVGARGSSPAATGVMGQSGTGTPAPSSKTGVYGYATQDATAMGVRGVSSAGRGLQGEATSGLGVRAAATSGTGAYATATTGTAVYAAVTTSGYALRTSGRLKVDKASGVATIAAGNTSVLVTPGLDVTTTSFVLLTPKADIGTRRLWYTTDAAANTITIRVSSAVTATAGLAVGWLLLG